MLCLAKKDDKLASELQSALPTIVLADLQGLSTAFANDVDPDACYAQQALRVRRAGRRAHRHIDLWERQKCQDGRRRRKRRGRR